MIMYVCLFWRCFMYDGSCSEDQGELWEYSLAFCLAGTGHTHTHTLTCEMVLKHSWSSPIPPGWHFSHFISSACHVLICQEPRCWTDAKGVGKVYNLLSVEKALEVARYILLQPLAASVARQSSSQWHYSGIHTKFALQHTPTRSRLARLGTNVLWKRQTALAVGLWGHWGTFPCFFYTGLNKVTVTLS